MPSMDYLVEISKISFGYQEDESRRNLIVAVLQSASSSKIEQLPEGSGDPEGELGLFLGFHSIISWTFRDNCRF